MNQALARVLGALLVGACVSTDVEQRPLPVCSAREVSAPATVAIVQLFLDEHPFEICNAVVIAPTLLATAVNCVTPLLSLDDEAGFMAPRCRETGEPIEDGRFLFRYATTTPQGLVSLAREDGSYFDVEVEGVFVSGAASTCMADIAVLDLRLPLGLPAVPVRLEASGAPGDEVIIVGYDSTEGSPVRHATPATILDPASAPDAMRSPLRAWSLSGDSCAKPGAAVLAPSTGALIGLVQTTDRTINCDNAAVRPAAIQVAPFRQFLLEVADRTQSALIGEFGSDRLGIMACTAP